MAKLDSTPYLPVGDKDGGRHSRNSAIVEFWRVDSA